MYDDTWDIIEKSREARENAPGEYAGFLIRFVAQFIDGIAVGVISAIIFFVFIFLGTFLVTLTEGAESAGPAGSSLASTAACCFVCMAYAGGLAGAWLYYAGFESSSLMGTPGKLLMGIMVTDLEGDRISFFKATQRYILKVIFGILFFIGYIYILISDKKQGLYDVFAGTLVVKKN